MPLAEKITETLGGSEQNNKYVFCYIDSSSNDPVFSIAGTINVDQITDTGINEYKITIKNTKRVENEICGSIENIDNGLYKDGTVTKTEVIFTPGKKLTEYSADKDIPQDAAETCTKKIKPPVDRQKTEKNANNQTKRGLKSPFCYMEDEL